MSDLHALREALQCGNSRCECHRPKGNVHCPAHDDRTPSPSLSLTLSERGGKLLWHCHAGCSQEQVARALEDRGLLNGRGEGVSLPSRKLFEHSNTSAVGLTLRQYAEAKKLPVEELIQWGCSDSHYLGKPAVRIEYKAPDGELAAVRFRIGPHEFRWRSGDKPCLYGLWWPRTDAVALVEGESDCHTLWHHGIAALGLPGAHNWREDRDAPHFDGVQTIYVVIEPDSGGEAILGWLSKSAIRDRVRLVRLDGFKDPSEMHIADPARFPERWAAAIAQAVPWAEYQRAERAAEAAQLWRVCEGLARALDLLDRVAAAIRARGYAGDVRPALLGYLAMTSRLLERPLNLAYIAPSGAGKNRAVDAAELIPPEDLVVEKAGSARALVYSEADYAHKVVVVAEADSIPDDGPAASAVRALAADNQMAYDVVEKDARTGRHFTRHIVKPGPTGLITTSTRPLGEQLGTRMLEVPIPDDAEQTRAVLRAHAVSVLPRSDVSVDLEPFLALQRWLDRQGEQRVVVPFATVLADLVPTTAVRMRRDFRQLLTAIQAVALLYQAQRERTPEGWIVATLHDYQRVRELFEPIFGIIQAEGVTPAVRETVAAVRPGEEVSESELAKRLGLAKTTVHYRVRRALAGGWLVNTETRRGHPYKLSLGNPLPEETSALPPVEKVREVFECSNGFRDERDTPSPLLGAAERTHEAATETTGIDAHTDRLRPTQLALPGFPNTDTEAIRSTTEPPDDPDDPPPTPNPDRKSSADGEKPADPAPASSTKFSASDGNTQNSPPYTVLDNTAAVEEALPTILAAPVLGFDTETTGLDPHRDRLRLVQIATPERVYLIDTFAVDPRSLAPVFERATLVGHNLKFDLTYLMANGLPVPPGSRLFDTMLADQVLRGSREPRGLADLAAEVLGHALDKTAQRADWSGMLTPAMLTYAARDAAVLLPLHEELSLALRDADLAGVAELEFRALPAIAWLEYNGTPFDTEAWRRLADHAEAEKQRRADELTQLAEELVGKDALSGWRINWDSPKQVLDVLRAAGLDLPSTAEEVLHAHREHPLVDALLAYRAAAKQHSTYGIGFLASVHPITGRIHANWRQIGAASGRMACTRPNLQNIPRAPAYRACFRPPEGRVLVKADYSQIELRIAAEIAGDEQMCEAFRRGEDLHTLTAKLVLGRSEVTKEDRQAAKAINFGLTYGMGAKAFRDYAAQSYGIDLSLEEAEELRQRFLETYRGIWEWHRSQPKGPTTVLTLSGRKRFHVEAFTEKLNTPVQGTGADGLKLALALLWETRERCPSAVPVLAVHDEIVIECGERDADAAREWLVGCMRRGMERFLRTVPVEVEAKIVKDWSGTPV